MIAGHTAQVVAFGKCTGYVDTYWDRCLARSAIVTEC